MYQHSCTITIDSGASFSLIYKLPSIDNYLALLVTTYQDHGPSVSLERYRAKAWLISIGAGVIDKNLTGSQHT